MSSKYFKVKNGVSTPNITFYSAAANTSISANYLDSNTLSFSGTSGQLFSILDNMSGTIFSVNDISGIPSIEVLDTGVVRLAETFGNVLIGTSTDNGSKLQVTGNISVTGTVDGRDVSVDGTKLDGIEAGATADMTATEILNAIKTVDGIGSGLDADLLDGLATTSAATASTIVARDASGNFAANMITGSISGNAGTVTNGVYTTNAPLYDRGTLAGTGDWNTFTSAGIYQIAGASIGTNGPSGAYSFGQLVVTTNSNTVTQTYTAHTTPIQVWVRIKYNASDWQPWILKLNSGNFTSYAPSLTGAGATGTWGINVTGQSRSVKKSGYGDTEFTFQQLDTPFAGYTGGWASYLISNHGAGASYYNQTLIMPFDGVPKYSRMIGGTQSSVFSLLSEENFTSYAPSLTGAGASGNWGINVTGSAAKLTTGRTIALTGDVTYNSGAFDGSANVTATATLTSVGTAGTYTKVTTDAKGRVTSGTTLSASDIPSLDASKITSGTIDAARLPSYVDDVIEAANLASFPTTGETGKIYVALDTNKPYRWSGSAYIFITSGAVDSVAGKTGVVTLVKGDVGLGNVDNTSDASKNVLSAVNVTGVVAVANGGTGSNTQAGARTNLGLGTIATQNSVDYLNKTETYNAGHAPEGKNLANAVLLNDFANARLRGSVFTLTNLSLSNAQIDGLFDGKGTYLALTPSSLTFPVVIEFTLPRTLSYGASVGLSFGNTSWITRGVKIESFTEGAWVTRLDTATNAAADIVVTMNGAGVGTTAVRYTFSDPVGTASGSFRLLHLWGYNYNSDMWSQVLMARSGGSFYGDVTVPTLTATSGITNAGTLALSASGANIITASTNGLERIRIDASGNLGIGINTPTSPMHISGAATSNGVAYVFDSAAAAYTAPVGIKLSKAGTLSAQVSPTLEFEVGSGGGQARLYTTRLAGAGGNLIIETDNTSGTSVERVRVTSGGQVGIGASAPTNKLHVTDTSTSASTVLHVLRVERETNQIPQNGIGVGIQFSTETDNSSAYRVGSTIESVATDVTLNSEDFDLTFNTMTAGAAASEKVRISSLGHVGIGTNNPSERLHVVGNISVTGTVDGRDVSVDGAKLDGIAAGATANLGTVTSVSGTGSYNGLTLSGTVTGSGSLTLGGTPTGTWPISVSGNAATVSGFRNIGTIAVQAVSGSEVSCTTAQFVTWYTNNYSFLSYGYTVAKCSWDYAGNNNISDTVIGTLELAGCTIETFSDGTQYTIRITRPTTGEGSGTVLVYNNQGGLYNPGWRVLLDNTNISSYAPTLTGAGSSGTWPISITGSAASATTAGQIDGIEFRNGNSSNPVGPDTINDNGIGYITGVSLFGQNDGALYSQAYSSSWVHQIYGDYRTGQLAVRGRNNGTLTSWRAVLDSSNYSSYALPLSGGTVTGDLTVTGNLNNSSDAVLKTNITTINNALDTVDQLRGVEFDWKDTGKHSIGVIAQEVEQVLPDLVTDLENGTKAVAYANIVGVLIEAIKELRKEVEELKNK